MIAASLTPGGLSASVAEPVIRAPRFRLRPDVRPHARWRRMQRHWVLAQTWSSEHFEVTDDEWFLLRQLDATGCPKAARRAYNREYSPRLLSEQAMQAFLQTAWRRGRVAGRGVGDGRRDPSTRSTPPTA